MKQYLSSIISIAIGIILIISAIVYYSVNLKTKTKKYIVDKEGYTVEVYINNLLVQTCEYEFDNENSLITLTHKKSVYTTYTVTVEYGKVTINTIRNIDEKSKVRGEWVGNIESSSSITSYTINKSDVVVIKETYKSSDSSSK